MGGKTHSRAAVGSQPAARRENAEDQVENNAEQLLSRAEQEAIDALNATSGLLPEPPDLYTAEVIIARGLEYYYTILGARRYYQYLAEQQVSKEIDRQILRAFSSDSLDPNELRQNSEQLEERLSGQYSPAEITIALKRLLFAELLRVEDRGHNAEPAWSLNLPEAYQLRLPAEIATNHRWALINECQVDGAYLAQGQIALLLYRAERLAQNEQQRALLRRLFLTADSFPDPGYPGVRIGDLTLGQELSSEEREALGDDLRYLASVGALEEVVAGANNARHYRLAVLPEPESQGASPEAPALGFAANQIIAEQGLDGFYQRQGALDYQRRRLLRAAESSLERQAVEILYQRQLADTTIDQVGQERLHLVQELASSRGLSPSQHAELDNQLLSGGLYQYHLDSRVDGTTGKNYLALARITARRSRATVFARRLSVARRAELLVNDYGLAGYYRSLGHGAELRQRFLTEAERMLPGDQGPRLVAGFDPGILDPQDRWLPEQEVWDGISSEERQRAENWLLWKELLVKRPGRDGEEQEYALAGTPSAEIEER